MEDLFWCEETVEWVVRKKVRTEDILDDNNQHAQMITVQYAEIPSFLHDSAFYKALSNDDISEELLLPSRFYSATDNVKNFPDLLHLLEVMSFWSVSSIPDGVIGFCRHCHNCDRENIQNILNNVIDEVGILSELKYIFCSEEPLLSAIRIGKTEVVTFLAQNKTNCSDPKIIALSALEGNLSYIRIFRENGYEWSPKACENAALKGHLECLRFLYENGCEWDYQVYTRSASYDHWSCFTYGFDKGLEWDPRILPYLAQCDNSAFLQYAIDNGCPLDSIAVKLAVHWNCIDNLRILLHAGCPLPSKACHLAIERDHNDNDCLALLHQHGALWDEEVINTAVAHDNLSGLRFLHEQGCPWNEKTTETAARFGNLTTLKYAMENGCPYSDDIVLFAIWCIHKNSAIFCVKYLIEEQGLFVGSANVFVEAVSKCDPLLVQYLIDQGCDIHNYSGDATEVSKHFKVCSSEDESLLECVKIARKYAWDLRRHALLMLRLVLIQSSEVPLLCKFFQEEGYIDAEIYLCSNCSALAI